MFRDVPCSGFYRRPMYRCSVELSVQYDGQSQSESEHASLIDEHDSFNSVAKQIRFVF